MPISKEQRIRQYLEMVTGGSTEELIETMRSARGVIAESFAPAEMPAAEDRLNAARGALEDVTRGRAVSPEAMVYMEAIIIPSLRPVYDIVDGKFSAETFDGAVTPGHGLWTKLSADAALKARIEAVLPAIGRIELLWDSGIPYGGTGFVVGPNLLMTNRHVAQIFADGVGDRQLRFINGRSAGIDFKRDRDPGHVFTVRSVRMVHPYWDMAILEVEGLPAGVTPPVLAVDDCRDMLREEIAAIGYPAFDTRNPADVQDDLFNSRFQVKRLQPGLLQGRGETDSFGKIVPAATHDCSTLGGNSGSALVHLGTGQIVGLHFAGRYLERNYAVPAAALAADQRVCALGLNFAGRASSSGNDWNSWWDKADRRPMPEAVPPGGGASGRGAARDQPDFSVQSPATLQGGGSGPVSAAGSSVTLEVPLRITVALGLPERSGAGAAESVSLEAASATPLGGTVVPKSVADYAGRAGYREDFLSGGTRLAPVRVPMPEAADPTVPAPVASGNSTRLDYQNFSLVMHARRRLALLTASNVTKEELLREPERGRDYSRAGLFSERWFPDLRLDAKFQIPEIFYTQDNGAFDKGHIVRRDDVAWGSTFNALLTGNVDSFHVTNCSPQVAGYNRSDKGDRNWGDLENHVLSEAASERLCVFAGPVLADDDRVFTGKGPRGAILKAPVPRRFWKVVVARVSDGLASYGFVLEQGLDDVPLEFTVAEEFVGLMYPLPEISDMTGVTFGQVVLDADQYETVRGAEIALRAGTKRRKQTRR